MDHAEKVVLRVATHLFEIVNLQSQQKWCNHFFFSEKERKDISSQISLELALTYRKASNL